MEHQHQHKYPPPPTAEELGLRPPASPGKRLSGDALPKMKKFRFQLLAEWIAQSFPPCRTADIGGGKGLLSYLLIPRGFDCTTIDPVDQPLPDKYRDMSSGHRVKIPPEATVPRINKPYSADLGASFDLLVALHAHGVNHEILDTVAANKNSCVILPCCVIGEPSAPPPGTNWFSWLVDYGRSRGLTVRFFYLNFSGQNVGFYVRGARP